MYMLGSDFQLRALNNCLLVGLKVWIKAQHKMIDAGVHQGLVVNQNEFIRIIASTKFNEITF